MLRQRLLASTPAEWFGRPLRMVSDADMWRWAACIEAARAIEGQHG